MNTLIFSLLLLFQHSTPTADSVFVESEITNVTVYLQRAQLQRTVSITLKSGRNHIFFKNLSPYLDENSIQLRGDAPFTILSLSKNTNYFSSGPSSPILEKLKLKQDSLQNHLKYLNSDLSVLTREIGLLENTVNMINNQEMNADNLSNLLDLYRKRMADLEHKKIGLNGTVQDLRVQLDQIRRQISELGSDRAKRTTEIHTEILSEKDRKIELQLNYLVSNTGWTPSYDIRATDDSSPLNLSYKANVYQNTGIDWKDVTITISSANPTQNATLPILDPSYVGFVRPYPTTSEYEKAPQMQEVVVTAYSKAQSDIQGQSARSTVAPIEQNRAQTSFSYTIQTPYSVPSNGKQYTIEYRREDVVAEFEYSAIPKLSEKAYLTANITQWDQLDILYGQAYIYFDNTYVGKTQLDPQSFDNDLQVSLGVDESISIERKKLREYEERNFFGNKVRETYAWNIRVRNRKNAPVRISLSDQIPLSNDESIKVDIKKDSGGSFNKQNGLIMWSIDLQAGQTKDLLLSYQIEYPKGEEITF